MHPNKKFQFCAVSFCPGDSHTEGTTTDYIYSAQLNPNNEYFYDKLQYDKRAGVIKPLEKAYKRNWRIDVNDLH